MKAVYVDAVRAVSDQELKGQLAAIFGDEQVQDIFEDLHQVKEAVLKKGAYLEHIEPFTDRDEALRLTLTALLDLAED